MTSLDTIFKAYDVRGTVPDQLDERISWAVGRAFAEFAEATRVVIGRDMRQSGVSLAAAFADGVRSAGVNVVDIGLVSTDLLYFASGHLDAPGAMFTASHNPAAYNGIKLCRAGAVPVGEESGLVAIRARAEAWLDRPEAAAPAVANPGAISQVDLVDAYADHVRSFIDVGALRPLRVVADAANGMGGLVAPRVLTGLPVELEMLYGELDGSFPNHPADPIQPENLRDLQAAVLASGADIGLAFDGDADRVFLVDEMAQPVSGSLTTALVAQSLLADHPGATVLYNLICSKIVPQTISAAGGVAVRTRVGHSFIKQVMAETGALFGGEHSGHYYFRENYRADSGIIAALIVLQEMSRRGQPLSQILEPLRRYWNSGEVNTEVADPAGAVEAVARFVEAAGATPDRLDGLTVDYGDWWFNLRPSNTEPLLRLNVEAPDAESGARHLDEVLQLVSREAPVSPPTGQR